jgi:hypothetical protein
MPSFVIFVEGADTEPAKVPVYVVESEEHASLLCEGMKESEYAIFDFSFQHWTRSDRGKYAVWLNMICDVREGVYGNIVGGIHNMIDGVYFIMSGRRLGDKIASDADTETDNGGSQADEKSQKMKTTELPPPPDDPLCDRAQLVLQTLATRKAVDSDSRVTTAVVVAASGGKDSVPYKTVIADLRERGYLQTKEGRGGGVWLTDKGKERAAKL